MASSNEKHPDAVLKQLKEATNAKGQRNLGIIHDVCSEIARTPGHRNWTYTSIGERSATRGGPGTNTLNSPRGSRFRELILAWKALDGSQQTRHKMEDENSEEDLIVAISDSAIRARVSFVIAERDRLRREIAVLRKFNGTVIDLRPIQQKHPAQAGPQPLGSVEQKAIESLLSEKWRKSRKLERGSDDELLYRPHPDQKPVMVAPVGILSAISKLMGATGATNPN